MVTAQMRSIRSQLGVRPDGEAGARGDADGPQEQEDGSGPTARGHLQQTGGPRGQDGLYRCDDKADGEHPSERAMAVVRR